QEGSAEVRRNVMLNGLSVICIDNDERILEGMRMLLEGWGCNVTLATSFAELARQRFDRAPDIVLADYHLDGEDGLGAIGELRETYGRDLPALLVTADRSTDVRAAAEA